MESVRALDVVAVGLNVVDVLVGLPQTITHGEKHEVSDLLIQGGAPAGTAACSLAALGWRVGFVARLGTDIISKIARAEFVDRGVSDSLFIHDPNHQPGVAVVEIDADSGDRTVYYSLRKYRFLDTPDVPRPAIESARLVLVDGYEIKAALTALQIARETGCKSVLDVEAGDPAHLRELIALSTDIIMPLKAAQMLAGQSEIKSVLKMFTGWTCGTVIVTDGRHGSWTLLSGVLWHQPAFPVSVVDTTGCGDAFHGAYGSALLDGLPLAQRMEFASFVASRVAMVLGGRSGLPTRQMLRQCNLAELSAPVRNHILHSKGPSP
jgi:sugar/nucleoside kinase (ribokinase family)